MPKYRKKPVVVDNPVVVDAFQYWGYEVLLVDFIRSHFGDTWDGSFAMFMMDSREIFECIIEKKGEQHTLSKGDFIIKTEDGWHTLSRDSFKATYELVEE